MEGQAGDKRFGLETHKRVHTHSPAAPANSAKTKAERRICPELAKASSSAEAVGPAAERLGQAALARCYLNIPKVCGRAPVEGRRGWWSGGGDAGVASETRKQPKMAGRWFERKLRGDLEI